MTRDVPHVDSLGFKRHGAAETARPRQGSKRVAFRRPSVRPVPPATGPATANEMEPNANPVPGDFSPAHLSKATQKSPQRDRERKKERKNKHERSVRSEYAERNEVQLNPLCRRERELRTPGVQGMKTLFLHLRLGFCQKRATPLKPTLTYLKHIRLKQGQLKI